MQGPNAATPPPHTGNSANPPPVMSKISPSLSSLPEGLETCCCFFHGDFFSSPEFRVLHGAVVKLKNLHSYTQLLTKQNGLERKATENDLAPPQKKFHAMQTGTNPLVFPWKGFVGVSIWPLDFQFSLAQLFPSNLSPSPTRLFSHSPAVSSHLPSR